MKLIKYILPLILLLGCTEYGKKEQRLNPENRFRKATFEQSQYIKDKNYEVYLPLSYQSEPSIRYPVLYMMDKQNLFVDSLAYGGVAWNIHEVVDSLVEAGAMEEIIIVGIDHAGVNRFSEYMPQKPAEALPQALRDSLLYFLQDPLYADRFLQFLVEELKPLIDQQYRTLPDVDHTFIGGSSMGGLIAMYAQCEYPAVFGGALCLSTHWPIFLDDPVPAVPAELVRYFAENLPEGKKWYFDHGTKGIDQFYEPYQQQIDSVLLAHAYLPEKTFLSRKFEGHDHNEKDWNRRVHIPLEFVFGQ